MARRVASPSREIALRTTESYQDKPVTYAELSGGGQLATVARDIAKDAGIHLNRVIQAETLSLLLAAVEHGDAAGFLPILAAGLLPTDRFVLLPIENIHRLNRATVIAWLPEAAD